MRTRDEITDDAMGSLEKVRVDDSDLAQGIKLLLEVALDIRDSLGARHPVGSGVIDAGAGRTPHENWGEG